MGKFDKYTAEVTLNVDGQDWIVTPSNRQVIKLLSLDKQKARSEEGLLKMTGTLEDIFKSAYPDEDPVKIGNFVMKNINELTTQFVLKMGWISQEELDKAIASEMGETPGNPEEETKKASG